MNRTSASPTVDNNPKRNRTASYIRVSTDYDAQKYSPDHQLAACREYAEDYDLHILDDCVYNDAGSSATEMEHRTEVQRLLKDARQGKFDVVIFTAISRFARDLVDALTMRKTLEKVYGVRIISIEEGYDTAVEGRNSEMVFTVHAMLAANKSQEMSKALKRGLRQSAKRGRHVGNVAPYGYTKTASKKLVPNPVEARVIKDIFEMYLSGKGSRSIAEELNRRSVPTASRARKNQLKMWQASTVNAILHNEVYIGNLISSRWEMVSDFRQSRLANKPVKKQAQREKKDWVIIENAHDPIIDRETFQRVQLVLEQKSTNKGLRRTSNLLAGMMICEECRGAMIVSGHQSQKGRTYKYVVCAATRRIGKSACTNHTSTKYDELLADILQTLSIFARSDEQLEAIQDSMMRYVTAIDDDDDQRIAQLQKELERNQHEQMRNLEAYRSGLFSTTIIEAGQEQLTEEANALNRELQRLKAHDFVKANARMRVREVTDALNVFENWNAHDSFVQKLALQQVIDHISFNGAGDVKVVFTWQAPPTDISQMS
ncbi:recombinase family protein [Alicyclobacillus mengziensis]|uniref:Recombinase family protein n=1 Tax=Alicyclobacillus mengziensis TaxID=2931921 RepID=A0A9X7VWJ0_9BACL|nr:recombinase family protein [Alicyclobacillus mengziensis]QSO45944.1 recombinase family protein [Alicyclobacillus mengziensis]